jgi:hypothetical protein
MNVLVTDLNIKPYTVLTLLENRMLKRVFGRKRKKVRSRIKLHDKELHNFYSLLYIMKAIKSERREMTGLRGDEKYVHNFNR